MPLGLIQIFGCQALHIQSYGFKTNYLRTFYEQRCHGSSGLTSYQRSRCPQISVRILRYLATPGYFWPNDDCFFLWFWHPTNWRACHFYISVLAIKILMQGENLLKIIAHYQRARFIFVKTTFDLYLIYMFPNEYIFT